MPTAFDALASDSSSNGDESDDHEETEIETETEPNQKKHQQGQQQQKLHDASCFEDLTMQREDEELVLAAVYGDDYSKEGGIWGYPILCVHVKPPDLKPEQIGSELTLKVQLVKKYPFATPTIHLKNVKGLSSSIMTSPSSKLKKGKGGQPQSIQSILLKALNIKCRQLAKSGLVMVCELVQIVEDFLLLHNQDPTKANISEWDQMNARKKKEKKIAEDYEKTLDFMNHDDDEEDYDHEEEEHCRRSKSKNSTTNNTIDKDRIEMEFARQNEALKADQKRRRRKLSQGNDSYQSQSSSSSSSSPFSSSSLLEHYQDDDDDDDDTNNNENDEAGDGLGNLFHSENANISSNSRYESDFIELGYLGRGGGGEVVKVRNRLDRRIYAIKKVVLQSEIGALEKLGKLENAKLKREVTTISRMTHKNIVRYYQAWVEKREHQHEEEEEEVELQEQNQQQQHEPQKSQDHSDIQTSNDIAQDDSRSTDDVDDDDDSDSDSSMTQKKGFWMTPFDDDDNDEDENIDSSSSSSWSNEGDQVDTNMQDFDLVQSPLLVGFGTMDKANQQQQLYSQVYEKNTTDNVDDSESDWDTSQMMRRLLDGSRSVLYIQMEYCTSSLRQLIDDGALQCMKQSDTWKIVHQILEALAYIHTVRR
jgi:translation initiation factor 2-alpha kinase 4